MTPDVEATAGRKVRVAALVTHADGTKKMISPDGIIIDLNEDFTPKDGEAELTAEAIQHLDDMKRSHKAKEAECEECEGGYVIRIPGSKTEWHFDEDWQPHEWDKRPTRDEAYALYKVIHRETKRVFNPEDLIHG